MKLRKVLGFRSITCDKIKLLIPEKIWQRFIKKAQKKKWLNQYNIKNGESGGTT
jgi:hypothetical protein